MASAVPCLNYCSLWQCSGKFDTLLAVGFTNYWWTWGAWHVYIKCRSAGAIQRLNTRIFCFSYQHLYYFNANSWEREIKIDRLTHICLLLTSKYFNLSHLIFSNRLFLLIVGSIFIEVLENAFKISPHSK